MNRKYHSGRIPAGAGANGSALVPSSQGMSAARPPSTPRATYQAINSRNRKFGKKWISLFSGGNAFHSSSTPGGTLIPNRCTSSRCNPTNNVAKPGSRAT